MSASCGNCASALPMGEGATILLCCDTCLEKDQDFALSHTPETPEELRIAINNVFGGETAKYNTAWFYDENGKHEFEHYGIGIGELGTMKMACRWLLCAAMSAKARGMSHIYWRMYPRVDDNKLHMRCFFTP